MCGRTTQEEELARRYNVPITVQADLPGSWNIVPGHHRMPVVLPDEFHAVWLGENQVADPKTLLRPFPVSEVSMPETACNLLTSEISPRVNSPQNNDPDIVRPFDLQISQSNLL
jgi:putative SOS response-associated peptidase YedK